jgi:hypothetical protein
VSVPSGVSIYYLLHVLHISRQWHLICYSYDQLRGHLEMSSLWAWAQKPNTNAIYVICHIAGLSPTDVTDTNYTLLQPHNEISRPLLKLGPQSHQLNNATPE